MKTPLQITIENDGLALVIKAAPVTKDEVTPEKKREVEAALKRIFDDSTSGGPLGIYKS